MYVYDFIILQVRQKMRMYAAYKNQQESSERKNITGKDLNCAREL